MDWISAVPLSSGVSCELPLRPVTLRRHLSMGMPLSKSRYMGGHRPPLQFSSRRQKIDRVHNRQGWYALFRAEVNRLDPAYHLG